MKNRRGLSSVIGMIFLVVVLSSVIGYFSYAINLVEQVNDQVILKGIESVDKSREDFEIVNTRIDGGKFNLTIQNTGELPINFTRLWISNVTDNNWPLQNFTVNEIATPNQVISNVGQNMNLYSLESQAYSIKLVTQRGNSKEVSINSPNQEKMDLKLIALPETVPDKFRTTILFSVTNNMTNQNNLLNVKPKMQTPVTTGTASYTLISTLTPNEQPTLRKGDTVNFIWVYEISGLFGDSVTFTASLENGHPQNTASTTVFINDVLLSQQSATSLSSTSTTPPNDKDLIILHAETDNTPTGEYQMYAGDPEIGGLTISVETDNPKFITLNGTEVNIPPGNWNASLTYISAPLPDSLMDNPASMIYHFENNNNSQDDSTGNTNADLGPAWQNERPVWENFGGPHSSGVFRFDGDEDHIEIQQNQSNDVKSAPDTTALWFKADPGTPGEQSLYYAAQNNDNEYYKIVIDISNNIVFEHLGQSGFTPTKCQTSGFDYENGNWQHVVAVRSSSHQCELYVNGTLQNTSTLGTGNSDVNIQKIFIGAENGNTPIKNFKGVIDDVIHWNNYALTPWEVSDLSNTNYGSEGHLVTFNINRTDENGVVIQNIVQDTNYPLRFLDGKENAEFLSSFNYTAAIGWANFTNSERLVFDMQFVSGLDMDLRVDDTGMTGNPDNSYIQIPEPEKTFPSYITIIVGQSIDLWLFNAGPNDVWLTYEGTRLTFEDINSQNRYASIILQGNGTDINAVQDSILFPINNQMSLSFSTAKDPPSISGNTGIITPGSYKMKMQINGYDINSNKISRIIDFGTVVVKN